MLMVYLNIQMRLVDILCVIILLLFLLVGAQFQIRLKLLDEEGILILLIIVSRHVQVLYVSIIIVYPY